MFWGEHRDPNSRPGGRATGRAHSDGGSAGATERGTAMSDRLRPGDRTPASGQYEIVGPRGGHTGKEVTSTKDHPMPPTPQAGQGYVLVDPTKNGSGRK